MTTPIPRKNPKERDDFAEVRKARFNTIPELEFIQDVYNGMVKIVNHYNGTELCLTFDEWRFFVSEVVTIRARAYSARITNG